MAEKILTLTQYINQDLIKSKFQEMLGKRASGFISSLLSLANNDASIKKCTPQSIVTAGAMAATLELPINQNLGFAYLIPYNTKQGNDWVSLASFQIGYKGLIQLAQRSGQFKTINVSDVREGEIIKRNRLTGEIEFNWLDDDRDTKAVIGYVAYFELINGFSKSLYMSNEQLKSHGLKYSQSYKNERTRGSSLWENSFDVMASKTVLKLLISKYAPLSIDMQKAIVTDHAVINDIEHYEDVTYIDNNQTQSIAEQCEDKEKESVINFIENAKTPIELASVQNAAEKQGLMEMYNKKLKKLQK
jgi:recombination protein RecT